MGRGGWLSSGLSEDAGDAGDAGDGGYDGGDVENLLAGPAESTESARFLLLRSGGSAVAASAVAAASTVAASAWKRGSSEGRRQRARLAGSRSLAA